MKVALVHDYIKEFGGAEQVLRVLADMYPKAPIYTAFKVNNSTCAKQFKDRKIIESKWGFLLKHFNLYSPLRFLAPLVWRSLDLSKYDLVITSTSSYFARGFRVGENTKVVAYCHTPPRFLYGYETSINLQKYWIVRVYAVVVNHFLRYFDFWSANKIKYWIVNSENVKKRVWKFYRKDSEIIYPPVEVKKISKKSEGVKKENYFLIVSRLVGAKGLVEAARAAEKLKVELKIVGEAVGLSTIKSELSNIGSVQLLGRVGDDERNMLYAKAKGFIALAKDEDFGVTPVEAMAAGTPVLAFNGGGFRESVVNGKTGVFIDDINEKTIEHALGKFNKIKWNKKHIQDQASLFGREVFERKMRNYVRSVLNDNA